LSSLVAVALVVVLGGGNAHAEVQFRKKAPAPSSESSGLEGQPSGGEPAEGEAAAKPAEGEAAPGPAATQAQDTDFPEAQQQREKARADAALARQARNAQLAKKKEEGTPFYQKWQFWAITGGVLVGAAALIWGGSAVYHQMNGGDIRPCSTSMSPVGCYGEGR
jgi:hypothetical protein